MPRKPLSQLKEELSPEEYKTVVAERRAKDAKAKRKSRESLKARGIKEVDKRGYRKRPDMTVYMREYRKKPKESDD